MRPKVAYQVPDIKSLFYNGRAPDYVDELMSKKRFLEVGLFDAFIVEQLMDKVRNSNLSRMGTWDNITIVLTLSTMILNEVFVCDNNSGNNFQESKTSLKLS